MTNLDNITQSKPYLVNLYAILDVTTDIFSPVMEAISDASFIRMIQHHIALDPDSTMALYPGDHKLVRLGQICKMTGEMTNDREHLCSVSALPKLSLKATSEQPQELSEDE